MAKFTKTLIAAGLLAAAATPAFAADYSGDIHKNDFKWMQFNIMHTIDQRPFTAGQHDYNDTYLEMEFGGRSGIFDLYGYVDVFDILDNKHSDKHGGQNLFMKFAPRLSLDAMTGYDLSFGPVQELYIANLNNIADGQMENQIGLGADVMVPWFGKVGMNLYARYSNENQFFTEEQNTWNGY
ncbi:MAG: outer membrane protein OmpK, partial [Aeromonas sp.]